MKIISKGNIFSSSCVLGTIIINCICVLIYSSHKPCDICTKIISVFRWINWERIGLTDFLYNKKVAMPGPQCIHSIPNPILWWCHTELSLFHNVIVPLLISSLPNISYVHTANLSQVLGRKQHLFYLARTVLSKPS
jgi:hypothetical protein